MATFGYSHGWLVCAIARTVGNYDAVYDVTATSSPEWNEWFGATKDIGLFKYVQAGVATADTGVLPTKTVPMGMKGYTFKLQLSNSCWTNDYCDMDWEFLDASGAVIAAIRTRTDGTYRHGIWYGPNLSSLTKAGVVGSYPSTYGALTATDNAILFTTDPGDNRNQSFSIPCTVANIKSMRFSNVRVQETYTGGNGCSAIVLIRIAGAPALFDGDFSKLTTAEYTALEADLYLPSGAEISHTEGVGLTATGTAPAYALANGIYPGQTAVLLSKQNTVVARVSYLTGQISITLEGVTTQIACTEPYVNMAIQANRVAVYVPGKILLRSTNIVTTTINVTTWAELQPGESLTKIVMTTTDVASISTGLSIGAVYYEKVIDFSTNPTVPYSTFNGPAVAYDATSKTLQASVALSGAGVIFTGEPFSSGYDCELELVVKMTADSSARKHFGGWFLNETGTVPTGYRLVGLDANRNLSRFDNGTETGLVSTADTGFVVNQTYTLLLKKTGGQLEMYVDGVRKAVVSDSNYISLRPALFLYGCTVQLAKMTWRLIVSVYGALVSNPADYLILQPMTAVPANQETRDQFQPQDVVWRDASGRGYPGPVSQQPNTTKLLCQPGMDLFWSRDGVLAPAQGYIESTVTISGEGVRRRVLCYTQEGLLVGETWSRASDGKYRFDLLWMNRRYMLVAQDDPTFGAADYNAVAADFQQPTPYSPGQGVGLPN